MATCNSERFLRPQIDSILAQLGPDDELIVSDDESTDSTLDIISSYHDPRIKVYHHTPDTSRKSIFYVVSENFENALKHASGDYIFLSDHDDIWCPGKVRTMLPPIKQGCIVQSGCSLMDENNEVYRENVWCDDHFSSSFVINMIKRNFVGCCMGFPASLLKVALPFPKNTIMHDNWLGVVGHCFGYKLYHIPQPLIKYRRHRSNVTSGKNKNPFWFKVTYRIEFIKDVIVRRIKVKKTAEIAK